jgi:hypothetical protein
MSWLEGDARACGGCFPPPRESTVVTDHRMAFTISPTQTVLWDQIQYAGDPSEFAWVLPVKPGTEVELSRDAWIGALDASTQPQIQGPAPTSRPSTGCGCGSFASATAYDSAGGGAPVQVVEQKVVGPYETVTLRSTDPNALDTWLTSHGFAISDTIKPTVDAYVSEGFDFIALRLQPGQGVRAMQPVRVVAPGADPSLPLRMVAAGVGSQVGLTLFVIGEGRYEAQNFPNATVDDSRLVWDSTQNRSNYQDLVEALMGSNGGRTWVTEYAQKPDITRSNYPTYLGFGTPGLADAYYSACQSGSPGFRDFDASLDGAPADDAAADASDASDTDASDASSDAASPADAGTSDPCSGFDDLDLAMKGLHSYSVYLTRLRARLAPDALKAGDLRLIASRDQSAVSNLHYASADNPLRSKVGAAGVNSGPMGTAVAIGIGIFAAFGAVRRRRRPE